MDFRNANVERIVEQVDNLQEPFRENAIEWLCKRTQRPLSDLHLDLDQFLREQDPFVRDFFIRDTISVLDLAATHFGSSEDQNESIRPDPFGELLHSASFLHR